MKNSNVVVLLSSLASGQSLASILPMLISVVAMDMFLELHHIIGLVVAITLIRYYSNKKEDLKNPLRRLYTLISSCFSRGMNEFKFSSSSDCRNFKLVIVAAYIDYNMKNSNVPYQCFITPMLGNTRIYTFLNRLNQAEVVPGIFVSYSYNKTTEVSKKGATNTIHEVDIIIRSKLMSSIHKFVEDAENYEMDHHIEPGIFESKVRYSKEGDLDDFEMRFRAPMRSTKTFDTLFFDGKERLVQLLDRFVNQPDQYARVGMPHSLGLLFHGSPGCGKTSAIKAIANHLQRHVCIINEIPSLSVLRFYFGKHQHLAKRIFVFEEIDAGRLGEALKNRSSVSHDDAKTVPHVPDVTTLALSALASSMSKKDNELFTKPEKKSTITLAEFLEFLDGIEEMPNRIIIFTTNHPERLDPALLRPGRVDLMLEFKKMRRVDISNMYKLWFQHDLADNIQRELKDYVFSQAEIGELFSSHDLGHIHSKLKT